MHESTGKILLIGYGNPGRVDDGLGPALADAVSKSHIPGATVDANYQLQVEDARAVADHDVIVLADADVRCDPPFSFELIQPSSEVSFSSHSISPASLNTTSGATVLPDGGCATGCPATPVIRICGRSPRMKVTSWSTACWPLPNCPIAYANVFGSAPEATPSMWKRWFAR